MSARKRITRRELLRKAAALAGMVAVGSLAACGPTPTPQIIKETVVVEKPVEKVVKETVVKEVAKEVTKEVTKVVEKPVEKIVEKIVTAVPTAAKAITLRFHFRAGGETGSEKIINIDRPAEFMKSYPWITIKNETFPAEGGEYYRKIDSLIVSGTLGDNFFTESEEQNHARYATKGFILPVDEWLKATGHSKDEWVKGAQGTLSYDGKMYGMPKHCSSSTSMIWINHDMLKAAGIAIPDSPYTLAHDRLAEWAIKLSKGAKDKRDVYGFLTNVAGITPICNQVRSQGGFLVADDGVTSLADTEPWLKMATWNYNLYQRDKVSPLPGALPTTQEAMFIAGKLAMMFSGRWSFATIRDGVAALPKPFEYAIYGFPRYDYSKGWTANADSHPASKFTKYPEEAMMFNYALADRRFSYLVANGIGYLTARVDDLDVIGPIANTPFMRLQYKLSSEGLRIVRTKNKRGGEHATVLTNELAKLWLGKEKPTPDFMKSVKAAAESVLSKPEA